VTATTQYPPVRVEAVPDAPPAGYGIDELRDGLRGLVCEMAHPPAIEALHDDHPAYTAWFDMKYNDVVEEVLPEVVGLVRAAIERRLPWTWAEGEDR
jgi:hypothetical protein